MRFIKFGLIALIIITLSACGAKKAPEMETPTPAMETEAAGTLTETEPSLGGLEVDPSMHQHVESVRVYIDGYICAACFGPMKRNLQEEENIKIIVERPEVSMIEVVPQPDEYIDLLDVRNYINNMEGLTVTKMEVVAAGKIVDYVPVYYKGNVTHEHTHERYQLVAGKEPYPYNTFILAEGPELERIKEADYKRIAVIGNVTSFYDSRTPILHIMEFKELKSD